MNNIPENTITRFFADSLSQPGGLTGDSLRVQTRDTVSQELPVRSDIPDTSRLSGEVEELDLVTSAAKPARIRTTQIVKKVKQEIDQNKVKAEVADSTIISESRTLTQPFRIFGNEEPGFSIKPKMIWQESQSLLSGNQVAFSINHYQRNQLNWTLFIGILSILLLIYLKTYYQKLVAKVMNTLINFQLAETMLREKNSIVKRAFFVMNLNFILIFSLFIVLILRVYHVSFYDQSLKDYLLVVSIISLIIIVRMILYYAVAFLFEWFPAIQAHLHNSYLINKNLGLLLLPVVFIAIYTTPFYSKIVIFSGLAVVIIASVFKLIRGFQIIIKNGVLLFYAILYLCTLELLPIVLGSKLIILLR